VSPVVRVLLTRSREPNRLKSRSKPKGPKKEAKEPRKSLSAALREHGTSRRDHHGTIASPILIDSDNDNVVPYIHIKRTCANPVRMLTPGSPSPPADAATDNEVNRHLFKSASRDPKYLPPFSDFPDDVAHRLRALRVESLNRECATWVVADSETRGIRPPRASSPTTSNRLSSAQARRRSPTTCCVLWTRTPPTATTSATRRRRSCRP
jgi:hypothetical protein